MKLFILFVILIYMFSTVDAFLMFPCTSYNALDSFYQAFIQRKTQKLHESNLMKYAIPGDECNRKCKLNDQKVCHFQFSLEYYQVLGGACNDCTKGNRTDCFRSQCITADGVERTFLAVNRQLPGPAIQVCQNDIIVVDVENHLDGMATTIHWHGFLMKGTPYSDGVPFLTQCPIHSSSTFRYAFYANELGTHFYHSHAGLHKTNGLYGALIVRSEKESKNLYDFDLPEFYIFCHDWMHEYAEEYLPGLASKLPIVHSILINGHSRYLNKTTMKYTDAPLTVYNVQHNKRYRFRIINAAFNVCPFQIQIERHNFTIIESDGEQMVPVTVDTLFFLPGERYDIVVNTIHEVRDYWIRVTTLFPCRNANTIEGFAVLRYHNGPAQAEMRNVNVEFVNSTPPLWNESYEIGKMFNTPQPDTHGMSVGEAHAVSSENDIVQAPADQIFYLIFDTPLLDNEVLFTAHKAIKFMVAADIFNLNAGSTINNISLMTPPYPLLSQKSIYDESIFCDSKNLKNCIANSSVCQCIHRLKVKLNSIVELVLIDLNDPFTHPFHLHGHKFYVMDMGVLNANLTLDHILENGIERPKNPNKNPPLKDTIHIPNAGYARVKFKANNPGFWIGHCHYDYHLVVGMAVILQVGELEEMKKAPDGYVECNNYLPNQIV